MSAPGFNQNAQQTTDFGVIFLVLKMLTALLRAKQSLLRMREKQQILPSVEFMLEAFYSSCNIKIIFKVQVDIWILFFTTIEAVKHYLGKEGFLSCV